MKKVIAALMLLTGGVGIAAPAPYPITINSRAATAPPVLVFRASESLFRAYYTDGPTASDITGDAPFMAWFTNDTAVTVSTAAFAVVGNASTGVVDFTFPSASVNYTPGLYGYEIGVKSATGTPRVYKQGAFTIEGSPYSTGADPADWGTNLNWATVALFLNPEYGPSIGDDVTIVAMTTNSRGQQVLSAIGTLATNAIPYLVHLGTNYGESGNIVTFSGTAVTRGGANHLVFTDTGTNGVVPEGRFDVTNSAFWTAINLRTLESDFQNTNSAFWTAINLKASQADFDGSNTAWYTAFNSSNTALWSGINLRTLESDFQNTNTALWIAIDAKVAQSIFDSTNTALWAGINAKVDQTDFDGSNTAFWVAINANVLQSEFDLTNSALWGAIGRNLSTNAIQDTNISARLLPASTNALIHANGSVTWTGTDDHDGQVITNVHDLFTMNKIAVIGSNDVQLIGYGQSDWTTTSWLLDGSGGATLTDADDTMQQDCGEEIGHRYLISLTASVGADRTLAVSCGGYDDGIGSGAFSCEFTASSTNDLIFTGDTDINPPSGISISNMRLYDLTAQEDITPKDIRGWKIAATGKTDLVTFNALSNQVQGVAGSLSTISNRVVGAISTNSESWSITYPTNAVTYRMFSTPANGTLTKVEVASTIGGTLNLVAQPKTTPITTYSIICTNVAFSPTGTVASTTWIASSFAKTNWLGVRFMTRNGYPVADTNNTTIQSTWTIP